MVRKSIVMVGVPMIMVAAAYGIYSGQSSMDLMAMCRGRSRKKRTNYNSEKNAKEESTLEKAEEKPEDDDNEDEEEQEADDAEDTQPEAIPAPVDVTEALQSGSSVTNDQLPLKSSSKCSKCKVVEKKLTAYMAKVEAKKIACSECKTIGLFKAQLRACHNKDVVGAIFQPGKSHTSYRIRDDERGYGYQRLFVKYFNDRNLTSVEVDDPYIKQQYQFANFLRLCEMAVKTDNSISSITLKTKRDSVRNEISDFMKSLKDELKDSYNISLTVIYSNELHDREIRLNNGFNIKLGRGLDYFKPLKPYEIGYYDMDMRPCRATTIDIIHERGTTD